MEYKHSCPGHNTMQSVRGRETKLGGSEKMAEWKSGDKETEQTSSGGQTMGGGAARIGLSHSLVECSSSSSELLVCLFSTTRLLWPNFSLGFWNPIHSASLPEPSLASAMAHCSHHWFNFASIWECKFENEKKTQGKNKTKKKSMHPPEGILKSPLPSPHDPLRSLGMLARCSITTTTSP